MKTKLLVLLFLAVSSLFARTHVAIGIGIGYPAYDYGYYLPPPPPPPVVAYVPAYPGPEYTWVPGYWYPAAPRYYGHRYYRGHWRRR